jgi:hypothetical protein
MNHPWRLAFALVCAGCNSAPMGIDDLAVPDLAGDLAAADAATAPDGAIGGGAPPDGASPDGAAPGSTRGAQLGPGCVTLMSCGLEAGPITGCTFVKNTLDDPSTQGMPIDARELACLAAAGSDCDAARRCVNAGQAPTTCASLPCTGAFINFCDALGERGAIDCSLQGGLTCVVDSIGRGECGAPSCGASQLLCAGSIAEACNNGTAHETLDCASLGAPCVSGQSCVGTGSACSAPGFYTPLRCEGDVLVNCVQGFEARRDCAALGEHCLQSGQQSYCALGNTCSITYASSCSGSVLSYCDDGVVEAVDCVALGFAGGCVPGNGTTTSFHCTH